MLKIFKKFNRKEESNISKTQKEMMERSNRLLDQIIPDENELNEMSRSQNKAVEDLTKSLQTLKQLTTYGEARA